MPGSGLPAAAASGGAPSAMPPIVNEPPYVEPLNRAIATLGDLSWDSVSQTSSTSGYRDNYSLQTGLLSPDGSLSGNAMGGRSSSQHSLLMLFETQDEDTLI